MTCEVVRKKMNGFIKGTLNSLEQRRVYYHIIKCNECKEVLLDEFSFYVTFNDLDEDLNYNYLKDFENFLQSVGEKIKNTDKRLILRYRTLSVLICLAFIVILYFAIRLS